MANQVYKAPTEPRYRLAEQLLFRFACEAISFDEMRDSLMILDLKILDDCGTEIVAYDRREDSRVSLFF